jgi:hypothetical protein
MLNHHISYSPNMSHTLELGSFWHRFMIPKPHGFHRPLLGAKKAPATAVLHPWDEDAFINVLAANGCGTSKNSENSWGVAYHGGYMISGSEDDEEQVGTYIFFYEFAPHFPIHPHAVMGSP